jgi:predicted O-linked N-acetylglucosamine transferase (SPINDLY family)
MSLQELSEQAVALHQKGHVADAERLYLEILAAAPDDFTASYMLGAIRFQQGRNDEALALFETALKTNPAAVGPLIYYGLLLQAAGRPGEALASFDRALAVDANLADALVNRGNVLCDLARFTEALASHDKALSVKPDFDLAWYNRGIALRGLGRPEEALASFDKALAIRPGYGEALNNRGSMLRDLKQFAAALASFDRLLSLEPGNVLALYNRGTALQDLNRFSEALDAFDRALAIAPGLAVALHNRGIVLQNLKRFDEALSSLDRALAIEPNDARALNNRGNVLKEMKRWREALASTDKALAIKPDYAEALNNRGTILQAMKRFDQALASFEQALAIAPDNVLLLFNRGIVLLGLKRFTEALASLDRVLAEQSGNALAHYNRGAALKGLQRLPEALASYDRALVIEPRLADAHIDRGDTLRDMGRFAEALACYGWALAIAPDNITALNNRGSVLQALRRFDEALKDYDAALRIDPDFILALYNRGNLLWSEYRRFDGALRDLEKADRIDPEFDYLPGDLLHLRIQLADWRALEQQIALIDAGVRAGKRVVRPFIYQAISQSPSDLQAASVLYAAHRFPPAPALGTIARRAPAKLRVGYMSGEFREQATAFLTAGLYEHHDKSKFELVALDTGWSDGGATRKRLEAGFDKFIDIAKLPDKDAADRISAEEIDILVNLNGYFGIERMGVFAHKPAPIQVNYLGFPATLGAPYIDYILADRIVIPETERQFYTENVVYLPDTYQVNDSRRPVADITPTRAECGLPAQAFVFCNFNHIYKLTPAMFAVWMNILRQTPGSVLWLLESNTKFPQSLREQAARHGVAGERLVFAPPTSPDRHLARMKLADLFVDSLPYNAHTTASDSLWAGLPLLTCRGTSFPGRVAASLLHAIGLPELVTASLEEYQALALELAGDPAALKAIRQKLERNRLSTPLFDTNRFRRHLESAYTAMWEIFQRGESARGFSVAPVP